MKPRGTPSVKRPGDDCQSAVLQGRRAQRRGDKGTGAPRAPGDVAGLLERGLSWSPLAWAGRIGFGIYLIHMDVLHGLARTRFPRFVQFMLATLVTLAVATVVSRGPGPIG